MLQMNFVGDTKKTAHAIVVTRKYVIISIFMSFERKFLLYTFCSAITYVNVNYDYIPETFAT